MKRKSIFHIYRAIQSSFDKSRPIIFGNMLASEVIFAHTPNSGVDSFGATIWKLDSCFSKDKVNKSVKFKRERKTGRVWA